jgi:hypothetical protein
MLLLTLLVACDVPYDVPRTPPDGGASYGVPEAWTHAREELVKAKACFAERRTYCVTDRDVIDAAIQADLDEHFHSRMPRNERWLDELIGRARANWNSDMRNKHKKNVQALVEENWEHPGRDKEGPRVDILLFVPPGKLTTERNDWRIDSPLVSNGELISTELARQLDRYREEYPNMPVVRLLVDVPVQNGVGFRRWDIRHHLSSDRVILSDPTDPVGAWVSEPLGPTQFLPYLDGTRSFGTADLERCRLPPTYKEAPDCTKHPPYAPVKKRVQAPKRGGPRPGWSPEDGEDDGTYGGGDEY